MNGKHAGKHRRTGNFLPGGGGGKSFAQEILASCPCKLLRNVQSERNEGHMMQKHRPYWHMKVDR